MHYVIMSGVLGGAGAGGVPRPPLYHHRGLHQVDIFSISLIMRNGK